MTLRGILFDIDDTLFDYSASERFGVLGHLEAEGLSDRFTSPDEALRIWREIMEEEYSRFLAGEITFKEQQQLRVMRFLDKAGIVPDDPDAWFARYAALRNARWEAFPDAAPVLDALAKRFRLGVISNSSLAHQLGKLESIGLGTHFAHEVIVCSSEYGCAKPDPAIFLEGCARLGLEPYETAYVGDKYDVDAIGARDAGLTAFWIDRSAGDRGEHEGIKVIHSLTELLDVT